VFGFPLALMPESFDSSKFVQTKQILRYQKKSAKIRPIRVIRVLCLAVPERVEG
jgi:hypothetical protein